MHADALPVRRTILLEEVEIALLRLEREACATACAEAARLRLAFGVMQAPQVCSENLHTEDPHTRDLPMQDAQVQAWRLRTAALVQACLLSADQAPAALLRAFGAEFKQWPLASELAIAAWELLPSEAHQALVVNSWLAEGRQEEAGAWSQSLTPNRWPATLMSVKNSGHVEVSHGACR